MVIFFIKTDNSKFIPKLFLQCSLKINQANYYLVTLKNVNIIYEDVMHIYIDILVEFHKKNYNNCMTVTITAKQ